MKNFAHCLSLIFFSCLLSASATGQTNPSRVARLVVPFPPGGTTDIVARALADRLAKPLGQPVIVENRGGSGGLIGAKIVASANPDGHTLLFGSTSLAVNLGSEGREPYDPIDHLVGVSMVAEVTLALAVNPGVQAKTPKELIALLKANPGKFNSAVPGMYSLPHLFALLFGQRTGTKFETVAYNGGGPAVADLLSGRTQMTFINLPTIFQHIKSGRLRAIGVAGKQRSELLPGIPTFEESGYPGLAASTWNAVLAPKGTPLQVNQRLNSGIVAILRTQEMKDNLQKFGAAPLAGSAQEADAFIRDEAKKWRKVVADAGIKSVQ